MLFLKPIVLMLWVKVLNRFVSKIQNPSNQLNLVQSTFWFDASCLVK